MRRSSILLLFAWPLVTAAAIAQGAGGRDYTIDTWQTEDGLPQNSVTAIAQSREGYLWMTTFNGLVRFDSTDFVVYDALNTAELPSSRVVRLLRDRRNALWIVTEFGDLVRHDRGRFTNAGRALNLGAPILFLSEDRQGDIWVGTTQFRRPDQSKVYRLTGGDLRVAGEPLDAGDPYQMLHDRLGAFWIRQASNLLYLNANQILETVREPISGKPVEARFVAAGDEGIWSFSGSELQYFTQGKLAARRPIQAPPVRPNDWLPISAMLKDRHGSFWVGTHELGLFRVEEDGTCHWYSTTNGLPHNGIRSLFEDQEGNLWVGTDGGGVCRLKPRIISVYDQTRGLAANIVMSVAVDAQQRWWVGMNGGGVNCLASNTVSKLQVFPYVWTVLPDRAGGLWFGTYSQGLHYYRDGTSKRRSEIPSPIIYALFEDSTGAIWVGGKAGVSVIHGGDTVNYNTTQGLSHDDVRAFAEDKEGNIYAGSNGGGLNRFERRTGRWSAFRREHGLADDRVWSLWIDTNQVIWIGTPGAGLTRLAHGKCTNYGLREGLHSRFICSILEDNRGHLWMSSNRGIFRVAKQELEDFAAGRVSRIRSFPYDRTDGLLSTDSSGGAQPCAAKTADGRLLFGTVKGLAVIDPENLPLNPLAPPVVISQVLVDGEIQLSATNASPPVKLSVPPGKERIEFHYAALSFTAPKKVRFKYRLEGFERDWVDAETRRVAYYTRLPPGDYRFQVVACNNDGVWNEAGAATGLLVLPQFWQTTWFRSLIWLAAAGAIGGAFYARVRQLERRRALQEQFSHRLIEQSDLERKRMAGELHDGLGQHLLVIKNLALLGQSGSRPGLTVQNQLDQISETASTALQDVRRMAYDLRPYQLDRFGLSEAIPAVLAQIGHAGNVEFACEIGALDGLFTPAQENHLFRIIQEVANNIVKHSGATRARMSIQPVGERVRVWVQDNGRGFSPGSIQPGAGGFGLPGLAERVRILGGTFELQSAPGSGTTIVVVIPIGQSPAESSS